MEKSISAVPGSGSNFADPNPWSDAQPSTELHMNSAMRGRSWREVGTLNHSKPVGNRDKRLGAWPVSVGRLEPSDAVSYCLGEWEMNQRKGLVDAVVLDPVQPRSRVS